MAGLAGEHNGEHLGERRPAAEVLLAKRSPGALARRYSRNFEIVKKSAIGPFLAKIEVISLYVYVSFVLTMHPHHDEPQHSKNLPNI